MDAAQTVVVFVIVILSVLLVAIGVQVFFILKEFRKTVTKANDILDDVENMAESVSRPLSSLSNLTTSLKLGGLIVRLLKGKGRRSLDEHDDRE